MTDSEIEDVILEGIVARERIRQDELKRIVAAGGAVWDYILGRWVEAPQ
jgi:hypothetical protein